VSNIVGISSAVFGEPKDKEQNIFHITFGEPALVVDFDVLNTFEIAFERFLWVSL